MFKCKASQRQPAACRPPFSIVPSRCESCTKLTCRVLSTDSRSDRSNALHTSRCSRRAFLDEIGIVWARIRLRSSAGRPVRRESACDPDMLEDRAEERVYAHGRMKSCVLRCACKICGWERQYRKKNAYAIASLTRLDGVTPSFVYLSALQD